MEKQHNNLLFEFTARPVPISPGVYRNCYDSIPVSILAETRDDAELRAISVLGTPNEDFKCKWELKLKSVSPPQLKEYEN